MPLRTAHFVVRGFINLFLSKLSIFRLMRTNRQLPDKPQAGAAGQRPAPGSFPPELRPFEDSNDQSGNALKSDHLKDHLLQMAKDDDRLKPLIILLSALEEPDVDINAKLQQAIADIEAFNDFERSVVPGAVAQVPDFKIVDFFESLGEERPKGKDLGIDHVQDPGLFSNWGKTVSFDPSHTFVIRTVEGVCHVVKWAAEKGKRVRVSGFRHTWTELFGSDGDVLVMFLPIDVLAKIPYSQPPASFVSELQGAEIIPTVAGRSASAGKAFCKIMAGTTNDMFRAWCYDHKTWCLPFSVIMVEVTFGGTNAVVCHGSGFSSATLSDLVHEVQYVDARGVLQVVNDPTELRAASGAFGLLGVVIAVTLEIDAMGVAEMVPTKISLPLAIPPPKDYPIPDEVKEMMHKAGVTQAKLDQAREDFITRCKEDYYLEWFWFPYQEDCWVNTWKKRELTASDVNLHEYPGNNWFTGTKTQQLEASLMQAITNWAPWRWLAGQKQAFVFGLGAMLGLPNQSPKDPIITYVSEALHFRRGIQNFRCLDSEWEIPIPDLKGERDYALIQRAWWDGIAAMYADKKAPVRVALEMRLTGGSDVLLAPQRGNRGTISIEVLTTLTTPRTDWAAVLQVVADKWTGYTDSEGNVLKARPHWAKQWQGLKVHGKEIEQYLKEDVYKEAFAEFREEFKSIVEKRGGTVEETRKRFANATMDRLIFQ